VVKREKFPGLFPISAGRASVVAPFHEWCIRQSVAYDDLSDGSRVVDPAVLSAELVI